MQIKPPHENWSLLLVWGSVYLVIHPFDGRRYGSSMYVHYYMGNVFHVLSGVNNVRTESYNVILWDVLVSHLRFCSE